MVQTKEHYSTLEDESENTVLHLYGGSKIHKFLPLWHICEAFHSKTAHIQYLNFFWVCD